MDYVQPQIAEGEEKPPKRFKKEVKKPSAGKVQRIRIYPNQQERLKLRRWMGTARWTYNRCLSAVEKESVKRENLCALYLNAMIPNLNESLKLPTTFVMNNRKKIQDEAPFQKGFSTVNYDIF